MAMGTRTGQSELDRAIAHKLHDVIAEARASMPTSYISDTTGGAELKETGITVAQKDEEITVTLFTEITRAFKL